MLHDGLIKDKQHVIHQLLIAIVIVISVYLLIFNSCPSFACCDICLKKIKITYRSKSRHANIDTCGKTEAASDQILDDGKAWKQG